MSALCLTGREFCVYVSSMELTVGQAELFPVFSAAPAKPRSRVRQFVDATLKHGPLLTPTLVAEALGISRQRVHVLLDEGRIATVEVAGERYVPCSAVELFMTEGKGERRVHSTNIFRRMFSEADRISDGLVN